MSAVDDYNAYINKLGPPAALNDRESLMAYAYASARKNGLNPTLFLRQLQRESGFRQKDDSGNTLTSPAGAKGIAQIVPQYHPQANVEDPKASIDYAAKLMASNVKQYGNYAQALAAYNGGGGAVAQLAAGTPYQETQAYLRDILGGTGQAHLDPTEIAKIKPKYAGAPDQFKDAQLTPAQAAAACGPAAAVAFARYEGRYPSLGEAVDLAKAVGWSPQGGMNGIQNEYKLMQSMGIHARLDESPSQDSIVHDASTGNPVAISTPVHYYVADAYNPATQQLHVGSTGKARIGGSDWMTYDQINKLDGGVNGALFTTWNGSRAPSTADVGTGDGSRDDWRLTSSGTDPLGDYNENFDDSSTEGNTDSSPPTLMPPNDLTMPGSPMGEELQKQSELKKEQQDELDLNTYRSLLTKPGQDGLVQSSPLNLYVPQVQSPFSNQLSPYNFRRFTAPMPQ